LYANESELAMLQHTWTLSPKLVNSLRVAFVRSIATGGNEAQLLGSVPKSIGIVNTIGGSGIGKIDLQGYSSFGESNADVGNRDNTWHLGEEFSYARGKHNFKFGADLNYRRGWDLNAKFECAGRPEIPAYVYRAIGRQHTGATGPAGEHRRLLG
jgi:hypothetical protein